MTLSVSRASYLENLEADFKAVSYSAESLEEAVNKLFKKRTKKLKPDEQISVNRFTATCIKKEFFFLELGIPIERGASRRFSKGLVIDKGDQSVRVVAIGKKRIAREGECLIGCKEIKLLRRLRVPLFIHTYYGHCSINLGAQVIVQDLYDSCLIELFSENRLPKEEAVRSGMCVQLLKQVAYLHNEDMVHADIKPENIVVSSAQWSAKLIDFEFAHLITEKIANFGCTLRYLPPEYFWEVCKANTFNLNDYQKERDVWALGITLFYIMCPWGNLPFDYMVSDNRCFFDHCRTIIQYNIDPPKKDFARYMRKFDCLDELTKYKTFAPIKRMLHDKPAMRLTANQAKSIFEKNYASNH